MARSYRDQADRKRKDAQRARETAAKSSAAVAATQAKIHKAETDLAAARGREGKRREVDAKRLRQAAERKQKRELARIDAATRAVAAELRREPWAASPEAITVLFVAASPEDQQPLRLDKEVREIQHRVRASEYRDSVRFEWRPAARTTDLLQAINETRPGIVHFSGHGGQDALVFEDADGLAKPLSGDELATLLRIASERIRLVVFNACESGDLAARACDHVQAAIGMDTSVDDDAAKIFAGQFYNAIGFGLSLETAFEQAKLQVALETGSSSGDPTLHTVDGISAAEVYLVHPIQQ
jgi:hypothetical protein